MNPSPTRTLRPVAVSLLAVVAVTAALLVGVPADRDAAHASTHARASSHPDRHPATPAREMTRKQLRLHDHMRKLWEDHVMWTRMAIVTFASTTSGDTGAFDASAARLLRNQADIGNAIKPYFGERAGDRLTALLRDHITIAVELLQAATTGDSAAFADARDRWYANADDVADAISALAPRIWPRRAVRDMMRMHLDQTLAEAAAELGGDYRASVRDYDRIQRHILDMADALSDGIVARFPGRFR